MCNLYQYWPLVFNKYFYTAFLTPNRTGKPDILYGMDDTAIDNFFNGKPGEIKLFMQINHNIQSLGPIGIKVSKSQITFTNKRQFAWVWLPREWDNRRPKDCVVLSFSLPRKIEDPQIVQVVEPYPGRYMHHVIIANDTDFTPSVRNWLADAYKFGDKSKYY